MKNVWIAVAIITVVLLFFYVRFERYEAPPPQINPPVQPSEDLNQGIEALKEEVSKCGNDKTCVRKALVKSMKKK
jgi:hypothetical protein